MKKQISENESKLKCMVAELIIEVKKLKNESLKLVKENENVLIRLHFAHEADDFNDVLVLIRDLKKKYKLR